MIMFSLIIYLSLTLFTLQLKTNLSLSTGDYCLYKDIYSSDQKFHLTLNVKSDNEEKNYINVIVDKEGVNQFFKGQVQSLKNEIIELAASGEYTLCFKPIHPEEVIIEYEFNTDIEQLEMRKLADKKAFENVKEDLIMISDLTNKLSDKALELQRKRYSHFNSKHILN